MFDRYLGAELVAAGFVVVAPQFRHMACGPTERDQNLLLLRDGFSLIGFRVGESLLLTTELASP